ncbi:MAG: YidC/Oxa1 family membrane protein insertase [Oscillospiraceae bacterium]|jgi:YidC/Oxa1 family membrane protein insertase
MSFITIPFAKLLLLFYDLTSNYGVAIILFALVVKLVLLPFQMKSKKGMARMSRLTPRMQELEKKYGSNKQKYQEEVAKLYRESKVNPMSGCIWTLIPFPILIALYSVIRQPLSRMMSLTADQIRTITTALEGWGLYDASAKSGAYVELHIANLVHENFAAIKELVPKIQDIDFGFLGMNMSSIPNWRFFTTVDWSKTAEWLPALGLFLIPIISALASYLSMKVTQRDSPQTTDQQGSMKVMSLMMPLVSLWFCFTMPAALGIYWIASSVLALSQDLILGKHYKKIMDAEDAEWKERERLREAELERKRAETERLKAEGNTTVNPNTSKKKLQAAEKNRKEELAAAERAAERAARRAALGLTDDVPESQVGKRRYARGRAYVGDRYINPEEAAAATEAAAAASAANDAPVVEESDEVEATVSVAEEEQSESVSVDMDMDADEAMDEEEELLESDEDDEETDE